VSLTRKHWFFLICLLLGNTQDRRRLPTKIPTVTSGIVGAERSERRPPAGNVFQPLAEDVKSCLLLRRRNVQMRSSITKHAGCAGDDSFDEAVALQIECIACIGRDDARLTQ
jgi:hypothetical protein